MKIQAAKEKISVYIVMIAGALLRLFYVAFSTIYDRQYDIGQIDLDAGQTVSGGHLAYIQYIYHNGLPDFDPTAVYQFHHPPLHHCLSQLVPHLPPQYHSSYIQTLRFEIA